MFCPRNYRDRLLAVIRIMSLIKYKYIENKEFLLKLLRASEGRRAEILPPREPLRQRTLGKHSKNVGYTD
jgi:hypothetical protein